MKLNTLPQAVQFDMRMRSIACVCGHDLCPLETYSLTALCETYLICTFEA